MCLLETRMNTGDGQSPEDPLQLCSMNSGSLPLKVLAQSSVFAGHGAKYVLTGGLNKEVKRILMHKNGVEEQEEDYATV